MKNATPRPDKHAIVVRLRDRDQCQSCKRTEAETDGLQVHQIVNRDEAANQLLNYHLLYPRCH